MCAAPTLSLDTSVCFEIAVIAPQSFDSILLRDPEKRDSFRCLVDSEAFAE